MGHSITCTFQVTVNLSSGASPIYGAMSYKDVKGLIESEKEYQATQGKQVVNAVIFPQTKAGERYMKGYDFAIMDAKHKIDYYYVTDKIPFYAF